jgi:hypothetical protein
MIPIDHARAFFGIEKIDETGLPVRDYSDIRAGAWSAHAALGYLRGQWEKGAVGPPNCNQIVAEIQALGLARLEELVTNWPDSLASATFKSDLCRFVRARFDLLSTLAREISDAISC